MPVPVVLTSEKVLGLKGSITFKKLLSDANSLINHRASQWQKTKSPSGHYPRHQNNRSSGKHAWSSAHILHRQLRISESTTSGLENTTFWSNPACRNFLLKGADFRNCLFMSFVHPVLKK